MTPQYFQVGEEVLIYSKYTGVQGFPTVVVGAEYREWHCPHTLDSVVEWSYHVKPEPHGTSLPWSQTSLRKKPKPAAGSYDEVIGWVKMGCPKKVLQHE